MLAEALSWLITPASVPARRMGHLAESIAIAARHRRCRAVWSPHLAASRQALIASARTAPRRRIALVLGSGHLLDVPLAELSGMFGSVWLVDIVQPWSSRLAARRYANVRLVELDVTTCLHRLPDPPPLPSHFLDQPAIDWVASVNLLSQLANPPRRWLQANRPDLDAELYGEALMTRHLDWLMRFHAPVCLLADIEQTRLDARGEIAERHDYRPLLAGWKIDGEWRWDLAPAGELADGQTAWHRVAALSRR